MKRMVLIASVLAAAVLVVLPAGVYAQTAGDVPAEELTEEERQAKLADIAEQLKEVEREVTRLSLLVTKLALEEQALVLQQQVEEALARAAQELQEPSGIAQAEPVPAPAPAPSVEEEEEPPVQEEAVEEEPLSGIALQEEVGAEEEEEEEQEERGFLGALGALGNLGTPELATVVILALLGVYLFARRLRERARRGAAPLSQKPMQPQSFHSSSEGMQSRIDDSRQELKEGVAWK